MSSPRDGADELLQQQVRQRSPRLEEVDVLMELRGICPDVVQLLDVYETNEEVQVVLEYCHGGDLFDCIKRRRQKQLEKGLALQGIFSEAETASVAKTLLTVLDVLHQRHIVHRDIKPENILLVSADYRNCQLQVKLTDFGLARLLNAKEDGHQPTTENPALRRSRAYSRVGSDYYAAPEVYMGVGYDTPVDIYSLGITLYVMLVGAPPSTSSFNFDADSDLSDEDYSVGSDSEESSPSSQSSINKLFPPEMNISQSAQELISSMIDHDVAKRITASAALKHEWILRHSAGPGGDIEMGTTDVLSKLSISLSTNSRLPLQGSSLYEITPPLIPSNSPTAKYSADSEVTLTLNDVCSKLAPIANGQGYQKKKRNRLRSLSHGELKFPPSKKHTRNISELSGDELSKLNITTTPTKKVRAESSKSKTSSLFISHLQVAA